MNLIGRPGLRMQKGRQVASQRQSALLRGSCEPHFQTGVAADAELRFL